MSIINRECSTLFRGLFALITKLGELHVSKTCNSYNWYSLHFVLRTLVLGHILGRRWCTIVNCHFLCTTFCVLLSIRPERCQCESDKSHKGEGTRVRFNDSGDTRQKEHTLPDANLLNPAHSKKRISS